MSEIRRATIADATGIARTHCLCHRQTYWPIFRERYAAPGIDQRKLHWYGCLAAGDTIYLAVDGADIVGFTHALIEEGGRARMTTLYLLQDWQRRGIGRNLLRHILGHLHKAGHAEAHFECLPQNTNAIAFYLSQGARENGRGISWDGGNRHEELYFTIPTLAAARS